MNNYIAWKKHLKELVRDGHCIEFVDNKSIQQIEDHYALKEPQQKIIRINMILNDSQEFGLTIKDKKKKKKQASDSRLPSHDQLPSH